MRYECVAQKEAILGQEMVNKLDMTFLISTSFGFMIVLD